MKSNGVVLGEIYVSRVRGLLFDIDGTLSDTDDRMADRLSRFLKFAPWLFRDRDPSRFSHWFVTALETPANFIYHLADRLGIDPLLAKINQSLSRRGKNRQDQLDKFWVIPGVVEMLEALLGRYHLAIVSARDAETTMAFLEKFGLAPYFETVVTAQSTQHTKPFPDPVLLAAEQLGLAPGECVMIGDTVVDVRAGNAAGAQTVAVLCGFGTQRELARAGATMILQETADLVHLLLD